MKQYQREFPGFTDLPFDPRDFHFEDVSWHNDACPRFVRGNLVLWCDYADPAQREGGPGSPRFSLCLTNRAGVETENVFVAECPEEMKRTLWTVSTFAAPTQGDQ